jgi:hypothetical protein
MAPNAAARVATRMPRRELLHVGGYGRSHFIEACAAVDGPIVPRREGNHRLLAALCADRRVVFARSSHHAVAFRDRAARGAPLRVVLQTFTREERLLSRREREVLATVAASQNPIQVHPLSLHETPGAPLYWPAGRRIDRGRWDARARGSDARDAVARRVSVGPSDRSSVNRLYPPVQPLSCGKAGSLNTFSENFSAALWTARTTSLQRALRSNAARSIHRLLTRASRRSVRGDWRECFGSPDGRGRVLLARCSSRRPGSVPPE